MRQPTLAVLLALAAAGTGFADPAAPAAAVAPTSTVAPTTAVKWGALLAREDMVWGRLPSSADEAPFIGNGSLGALIFLEPGGALGWAINRTDVTHRGARTPMGHVVLPGGGLAQGGSARLDLWNAEARGTFRTPSGELRWRSFAAASPSVIVIELSGLQPGPEFDLMWWPVLSRVPRAGPGGPYDPADLNPPPQVTAGVGLVTSVQSFAGGGAFAVAFRRIFSGPERRVYVLAVGRGDRDAAALAEATSTVEHAATVGFGALLAAHRAWWHQYYPASFLSVPDPRLEAFYWIQIYKLASAMRADGPIPGAEGPWFRNVPADLIKWDLDVPLTYAPIFTANRLALGESLYSALDHHLGELIANVPAPLRTAAAALGGTSDQNLVAPVDLAAAQSDPLREIGNLPMAAFLYWKSVRYRMDDATWRGRVLPLLGRTAEFYLAWLQPGSDGRWHLPPTFSPGLASVPDATFDLALLRWNLQILADSVQHLRIAEPRLAHWNEVLAKLPPLPTGESGLSVGAGRPLRESERYYSHLLALTPLHLLKPDRPGDRKLMEASLHNWESRGENFRGFSYAGAAAMYAYLGDGDRALGDLHLQLDRFLRPNTFDPEPATSLAAPLAAAAGVQDLLLQSWGGRIHVFPAVPAAWKDVAFANFRTEGAFLVSAVRRGGETAWVRIESQGSSNCRLQVAGWTAAVVRAASRPGLAVALDPAPGVLRLSLPRGAWAVLAAGPDGVLPPLAPVPSAAAEQNPYPSVKHG